MENNPLMDLQEIRHYLPHGYPFLLVDRVLELEPHESITALKNVSFNEPFFQGHFPGLPIMPGVLIVEAMAQAAGILGFRSENVTVADGRLYVFAGIDDARFKRQVVPGDQLVMKVNYVSDRRNLWKFEGKAYVGDQLACSANILCADRQVER